MPKIPLRPLSSGRSDESGSRPKIPLRPTTQPLQQVQLQIRQAPQIPKIEAPPQLDASLRVDKLKPRQKLFLAYYLADPERSARNAARKAGYSEGFVESQSRAMLKTPQIAAAIQEYDRKFFKRHEITHEKILQEMATIAFSNVEDYLVREQDPKNPEKTTLRVDITKTPIQAMAAVREIAIQSGQQKVSLYDKFQALVKLGQHMGMFVEPQQSPGTTHITIELLDGIVAKTKSFSNFFAPSLPPMLQGGSK